MKTILLGAAILAFAACGSETMDDPTDPTDPDPTDPTDPPDDPTDPVDETELDYNDVASLVGASALAGELAAMLDVFILSEGGTPAGFTKMQGDAFTVANGARGGVSFSYYYHCNDSVDTILAYCDGNADHSHVAVTIAGDATGAGMSMSAIDRDGDWAVRDLDVDQARVHGDAAMRFSAAIAGDYPAQYDLSYSALFDRVRYNAGADLPLSGKIDFSIVVSRVRGDSARDFAVMASLLFDGSATGVLTLDASRAYAVDLTTGLATRL